MAAKRFLGIDWGEKRIGLALADGELKLALPFRTVSSLAEVLAAVKEEAIDEIIIGAPRKMGGQAADNPLWLAFFKKLEAGVAVPVVPIDERLTSLAADALGGKKNEKAGRDEIAAVLLLQGYLDRQ